MPTGVYTAKKNDGSIYYRVSITFRNKHISLGSFNDSLIASKIYEAAKDIIGNTDIHYFNSDTNLTSYLTCSEEFPFDKYIVLLNFRDNNIYIKTPIYLCNRYFLYFLNPETVLTFNTDDLFYYSNHTILARGGYYYVNDYGMQTSILSRYGIRNHAVSDKDYIFRNGNEHDYRYENIQIINRYNGVYQITKNGRIFYNARIHINGDYIIGTYNTEEDAAIAFNKTADIVTSFNGVHYSYNYIEGISSIEYASIYNRIRISKKILKLVNSNN